MKIVLLTVLWALYGFAAVPPGDMTCAEVTDPEEAYPNDRFIYIRCTFPPHISKYVRADSNHPQYSVILVPRYPTQQLGWTLKTDGYNARPTNCNTWPDADYAAIVMRFCHDYYPDAALYPNNGTGSWGGPVNGENPLGWRMAATMKYVSDNYGHLLDKGVGATLRGCSYGGSTSLLQSMLIPDPWARALVNKVDACVPPTLLIKQELPVGQYWTNEGIPYTWGAFDWTLADFRLHADPYKYYRIVGSPADKSVVFDLAILDVCEQKKLACFVLWHAAGHNLKEDGVDLPFFSMYSGPDSDVRLDKPLVAFTGSTANYQGAERGHYNLGLDWDSRNSSSAGGVVRIPIRYRSRAGFGRDIPPQPSAATFNATLWRVPFRPGDAVHWVLGAQNGTAIVADDNAVTIAGLVLSSTTAYTELRVWK